MATDDPFVSKEQKNKRKNKLLICDFSDILVAKRKTLVTNATVLVAISSPALVKNNKVFFLLLLSLLTLIATYVDVWVMMIYHKCNEKSSLENGLNPGVTYLN